MKRIFADYGVSRYMWFKGPKPSDYLDMALRDIKMMWIGYARGLQAAGGRVIGEVSTLIGSNTSV